MNFRIELFVNDLKRSIKFYEEILGLAFYKKGDSIAVIKQEDFRLLLTSDDILQDHHYFKKNGIYPKGRGTEIILACEDVEEFYNEVLQKNYPIESALEVQYWGMKDFRIIDPDGYYLRITSG